MSNEEREKIIRERLEASPCKEFIKLLEVRDVNHKPHPYIVGPKHVAHASDKHGGKLGDETLNALPSERPQGYKGGDVYLKDITYDTVAFLQLLSNCTSEDLKPMGEILTVDGVDGMVLVDTPEKYRVSSTEGGET